MLQGIQNDISALVTIGDEELDILTKPWMSVEVVKDNEDDEPKVGTVVSQHVSRYTIMSNGMSYANYVHESACKATDVVPVESGLDKTVQCNDLKTLRFIIDAGTSVKQRMILETAVAQFAFAYRGMKLSLDYAGSERMMDELALTGTNKYSDLVDHMESIRSRVMSPHLFSKLEHSTIMLLDLISARSRSKKKEIVALFTTDERLHKLKEEIDQARFSPRSNYGEMDMSDVFTFILNTEQISERSIKPTELGEHLKLGSIVHLNSKTAATDVVQKVGEICVASSLGI